MFGIVFVYVGICWLVFWGLGNDLCEVCWIVGSCMLLLLWRGVR